MAIKNHIESIGAAGSNACNTGGAAKPVENPEDNEVLEPESPAAPATTEPPEVSSQSSEEDTNQEDSSTPSSRVPEKFPALHTMSYKEICGKTPWLNATYRAQHASPRYSNGTILLQKFIIFVHFQGVEEKLAEKTE